MKKFKKLFIGLTVLCLIFLQGCAGRDGNNNSFSFVPEKASETAENDAAQKENLYFKGIWLSFSELNMKGLEKTQVTVKIDAMMKNIASKGYTAVFGQIRPYGDAMYPSKHFPFSRCLTGKEGLDPGYDLLDIMITSAKEYGLEFHAWINPYRVRSSGTDPDILAENNIAKTWLTDGSNRAVAAAGGIYFNPAKSDVQKLILNGVKEILENYDIDGIHFDDYFYPTTSAEFDAPEYLEYKSKTQNPLTLDDWRRANISSLITAVYSLCHRYEGVSFGISPAGDISADKSDKNYNEFYADIPTWMSLVGYIDYIIPQIYFGYNHPKENFSYANLLEIWMGLERHSDLEIYIGLGAYKIGDTSAEDTAEWCDPTGDLLARQTTDAKKYKANGICLFSYTAAFSEKPLNVLQMNNMYKILGS